MKRCCFFIMLGLLLSGCSSYGVVKNTALPDREERPRYSLHNFQDRWHADENSLMLAFSGGGSRAAALSYGVLKELRNTPVPRATGESRLLDEVHTISSVSGGSFTAAYYGLHGDGIFDNYEEVFLRRDVQSELIHRALNPFSWFKRTGRTEMAIQYYEKNVFGDATFADMLRPDRPLIVINASDLGRGVRFSFVQEYFDLLCSDLSTFPVARAVTASSAVPVLFNPVVVQNFSECADLPSNYLLTARTKVKNRPELEFMLEGIETFTNHDQREFIHFVDGGITDNLGLRAIYETIEVMGGVSAMTKAYERQPPKRIVLISVNASTNQARNIDVSNKQPSVSQTVSAMSDIQLHRYNNDTIALLKSSINRWANELSTPEQRVEPYFILLDLKGIQDDQQRSFLNQTPTSFSLTNEQVKGLIEAGGNLLRNHPEFRRLVSDLATGPS